MEAGAQNGVDHDIRAGDELSELVARRPDDDVHIAPRRATGDVPGERGRNLIGLDRAHHVDIDALMGEDVGCDPPVAAVVAEADEDEHALGVRGGDDRGRELAGELHERRL